MIVTPVYDDSEAVELSAAYRLYLTPKAKLIISVILPVETDQCRPISNWDLLEQLKNLVSPDHFSSLRVSRSTKEFIRIEGETDTKCLSHVFMEKLNGQTLQTSCINEPLNVEVTLELPADANTKELLSHMVADSEEVTRNDITPSCIHLEGLPCKWFSTCGSNTEKPSEEVLISTFEKYGKIANIDIPMLDPYREETGGSPLTPGSLQPFDAFLQYENQSSTIDAIGSLQGMKLIFAAEDGKSLACDIKISIDTSNHFSEEAINKRTTESLKLQELEQQRKQEKEEEEAERKRKLEERKARARKRRARLKRKLQRQKQCEEKVEQEPVPCPEDAVEDTEEWEERKLLLAQRRLESIKLLTIILDKVNDLVQVNRLEEEQMNCEFAEEFSDFSVSTYSENSKVMSLLIAEEESSQHETERDTEGNVEMKTSKADAQIHIQRRDSFTDKIHQDWDYDDDIPLERDTEETKATQMHYHDHRIFKLTHSQKVPDDRCSKKLKIYETDEFINYLLNYYQNPEYARLFLETKESSNKPWCRRVVRLKGNGFQIKLQNLNGHFAEMNFIPELEEETVDDSGRWEAPIQESVENSQESSVCGKNASKSQERFVEREHEVPVTREKPQMVKSCEWVYQKTWDHEEESQSSESNNELKQVLEEISSTSEYFSEELSGISDKPSNVRRTSRKQRKVKQLKKLKHCSVSGPGQVCHHEDLLGQLLHSYCKRLKKRSRCKLTQACRRKPSFHHQYDSETSESDSDTEAEVRTTWKRKRAKTKDHPCFLGEKKRNKEIYSSSEAESSSSGPHQQKKNVWQNQHNGKPKRKTPKTGSCDSDEKSKRQRDCYFAEDVSDALEQEETSWDGEESQSSCSPSSSHPTGENEQLGDCSKGSYTDYWDWEHHFYTDDQFKS